MNKILQSTEIICSGCSLLSVANKVEREDGTVKIEIEHPAPLCETYRLAIRDYPTTIRYLRESLSIAIDNQRQE